MSQILFQTKLVLFLPKHNFHCSANIWLEPRVIFVPILCASPHSFSSINQNIYLQSHFELKNMNSQYTTLDKWFENKANQSCFLYVTNCDRWNSANYWAKGWCMCNFWSRGCGEESTDKINLHPSTQMSQGNDFFSWMFLVSSTGEAYILLFNDSNNRKEAFY